MTGDGRELVFSRWKFALVVAPFLLLMNAVSLTLVLGHELDAVALGKRLGGVFFVYLLTLITIVAAVHFARDALLERDLRARSEARRRAGSRARSRAKSTSGIPPRKVLGRVGLVAAFLLVTYWLFMTMLAAVSALGPPWLDDELTAWPLAGIAAALAVLLVKLAGDSTAAKERKERVVQDRAAPSGPPNPPGIPAHGRAGSGRSPRTVVIERCAARELRRGRDANEG